MTMSEDGRVPRKPLTLNPRVEYNIFEAKAQLSQLVNRVAEGDVVTISRRNVPVAELHPIPSPRAEPRPLGVGRELYGDWELPDSFFDPLPDWMQDAFEGGGS